MKQNNQSVIHCEICSKRIWFFQNRISLPEDNRHGHRTCISEIVDMDWFLNHQVTLRRSPDAE